MNDRNNSDVWCRKAARQAVGVRRLVFSDEGLSIQESHSLQPSMICLILMHSAATAEQRTDVMNALDEVADVIVAAVSTCSKAFLSSAASQRTVAALGPCSSRPPCTRISSTTTTAYRYYNCCPHIRFFLMSKNQLKQDRMCVVAVSVNQAYNCNCNAVSSTHMGQ